MATAVLDDSHPPKETTDKRILIAQNGQSVHISVDFVQFILLCAQKVVILHPIFKKDTHY